MDSSVSPKDEIWFLSVCHHISIGIYHQFNIKTFYVISVQYSSVFFCESQSKQRLFPPYEVNVLVFITETECVYCEVQTESLNIIKVNLRL